MVWCLNGQAFETQAQAGIGEPWEATSVYPYLHINSAIIVRSVSTSAWVLHPCRLDSHTSHTGTRMQPRMLQYGAAPPGKCTSASAPSSPPLGPCRLPTAQPSTALDEAPKKTTVATLAAQCRTTGAIRVRVIRCQSAPSPCHMLSTRSCANTPPSAARIVKQNASACLAAATLAGQHTPRLP